MPCGRRSPWRKKISGEVERCREEAAVTMTVQSGGELSMSEKEHLILTLEEIAESCSAIDDLRDAMSRWFDAGKSSGRPEGFLQTTCQTRPL